MHWKRALRLGLLLLCTAASPGCYLGHAGAGQWALLRARTPIAVLLADPTTPPELRERLGLVQEVMRFAAGIGLEPGERYTSYVDWPGDRVVTTVVATRPHEIEPAPFWFPIVGDVPYKGFFDASRAEAEARRLGDEGFDTCLVPVAAYSTLGWFDDPVTGPMLRSPEPELVDTLLHELVHAAVFAPGSARFNEGLASFVGQEASLRFYSQRGDPDRLAEARARLALRRDTMAALQTLRRRVAAAYAGDLQDFDRGAAEADARQRVAARLEAAGRDPTLADGLRLNDACLALSGTYHQDLPRHARALADLGGDLTALLAAARTAASSDAPLEALLGPLEPIENSPLGR